MLVIIAILFLLGPGSAGSETLRVSIAVAPEAVNAVPGVAGLQGGLQRLFDIRYGIFVSLAFTAEPQMPAGTPAASAEASAADTSARIVLGFGGGVVTVSTDLTRGRSTRSLVSTVPPGSPASLLSTMAGDLAFLFFSAIGFSTLPLSAPPSLVASLSIDTLRSLTGWNREDLEPVGLATSGDEVTLCFPHRYLTLGPQFRISPSTIRDIDGQSVGREPLQLSGIIAGEGDRLVLLSEREGRIAVVNPRLGTRQVVDAPGLSALTARLVGRQTVAALTGYVGGPGMRLYPIGGGPPRELRVAASYVPAFDQDGEGNLWAWDAAERRVRILTPGGREIFSIKPLFSAATMQLPQQLAVDDDGSFLLGGSAEVWKFRSSGIPEWRLTRIPGRPAESLPSSFDLGVNRSTGSPTILDSQSRRLLAFSSSAGEAARNGGSSAGASRNGGSAGDAGAARVAMLAEKATGSAAFADGLARDLLFERADAACLRAAETLRELTAESPDDEAAAGLLQTVLARRREVRAALAASRDMQIVSARLFVEPATDCHRSLALEVRLHNSRAQALTGVRVHVNVPSLDSTPSLAALESIPASQERTVRVPLGFVDAELLPSAASVPVVALVTGDRGQEGISAAFSFSAQLVETGGPEDIAGSLACRAVAPDALAASLSSSLLTGTVPDPPQPLAELAGILNALGAARRDVSGREQTHGEGMRALLRGLSADEADWTVVTASIASSLDLPAAILSIADRPLALVDTRIPFFAALSTIPELQRWREKLALVSPAGTLWIPLSGRIPPAGSEAVAWSFADAMDLLAAHDSADAKRSGLVGSSNRENMPSPFPLVLPAIAARPSLDALCGTIGAAAAGLPAH